MKLEWKDDSVRGHKENLEDLAKTVFYTEYRRSLPEEPNDEDSSNPWGYPDMYDVDEFETARKIREALEETFPYSTEEATQLWVNDHDEFFFSVCKEAKKKAKVDWPEIERFMKEDEARREEDE